MLGCFADENVHAALVEALRIRGLDIVTANARNLSGTPDSEIAAEALVQRRVLLTNDADFLRLLAEASGKR